MSDYTSSNESDSVISSILSFGWNLLSTCLGFMLSGLWSGLGFMLWKTGSILLSAVGWLFPRVATWIISTAIPATVGCLIQMLQTSFACIGYMLAPAVPFVSSAVLLVLKGFVSIILAGVALSALSALSGSAFGRKIFLLRPVFTIPVSLALVYVGMQHDTIAENDWLLPFCGGLIGWWVVAAVVVRCFFLDDSSARLQQDYRSVQQRAQDGRMQQRQRETQSRPPRSADERLRQRPVARTSSSFLQDEAAAATKVFESADCVICYEEFERGDDRAAKKTTLRCGHQFHKSCVGLWFQSGHNNCPVCRESVSLTGRALQALFT